MWHFDSGYSESVKNWKMSRKKESYEQKVYNWDDKSWKEI